MSLPGANAAFTRSKPPVLLGGNYADEAGEVGDVHNIVARQVGQVAIMIFQINDDGLACICCRLVSFLRICLQK